MSVDKSLKRKFFGAVDPRSRLIAGLKASTTNVDTIIGASSVTGHLGTFTGTTIADNQPVKPAIQALETAVETKITAATLVDTGGATLTGANDASIGTKYTTVQGFITYLLSSTGSVIVGFIQTGVGAVARFIQDKLRETVSVLDFIPVAEHAAILAKTSMYDATTAFEAAFATGKAVHVPAGEYILDRCDIPSVKGFTLKGDGHTQTIFKAGTANQPIFRKEIAAGVVQHGTMGGFSLKAHTSGSTGMAFDVSGFRDFLFYNIMGLSNGVLGFNALFDVSASPYVTYGVTWDKCGLAEQTGWANVWLFNNRSAGSVYNSNANTIREPWIYANVGLTYGIDAARSTLLNIIGGNIESNTGATAIRKGQATHVNGVWFELNGTNITYGNLADGVGNTGSVINCVFSETKNIEMTGVSGNLWMNNTEFGAQVFLNNNGTNIKHNPRTAVPAAPTLARNAGVAGAATLISATADTLDLFGRITYHLRYEVIPGAAGFWEGIIALPAGYKLETAVAGAVRDASGLPSASSPSSISTGLQFYLNMAGADRHEVIVRLVIKPS